MYPKISFLANLFTYLTSIIGHADHALASQDTSISPCYSSSVAISPQPPDSVALFASFPTTCPLVYPEVECRLSAFSVSFTVLLSFLHSTWVSHRSFQALSFCTTSGWSVILFCFWFFFRLHPSLHRLPSLVCIFSGSLSIKTFLNFSCHFCVWPVNVTHCILH